MPTYETDEDTFLKRRATTVILLFVSLFLVALLCVTVGAMFWDAGLKHGRCEGYGLAQDPLLDCVRMNQRINGRMSNDCVCGLVIHEVP